MSERKRFIKNLVTAFMAQGISLLMSVMMSLVVPKFLDVTNYSYWQLFIFYVGYVGFFHFGFNDGLYLRLGGMDYKKLDYKKLGTESRIFALFESVIAILFIICVSILVDSPERKSIFVVAAIYMVFNNLVLFFGYIFQAVNETKIYSYSVIIDRVFVLVSVAALLLFKTDNFFPFIVAYTISKVFALGYCAFKGREIAFSGGYKLLSALKDMWISTSAGIKLTIANIASMLILGIGRIVVDNVWGIETFGKISFSLTMTNFFILFIQQTAMVMFPALRRVDGKRQAELYVFLRTGLGLLLPLVLVAYIPIKVILGAWLPQYAESLRYLALLLPICVFDGKMQMLYNTYLKVLREEKLLLQINLAAVAASAVLAFVGGFVLNSLMAVIISMLVAIAVRSILAEILLSRKMHLERNIMIYSEVILVALCVMTGWFMKDFIAFIVDITIYLIFILVNFTRVKECLKTARSMR